MKIIKDNSNKEVKIKCKYCKSKMLIKIKEFNIGKYNRRYINCPICKQDIWLD